MYSILIYGFPLILVLFEMGLRHVLSMDTFGFLGPTLSAAAITSLVGNVKPKTIEVVDAEGKKHLAVNKLDNQVVAASWLVLFFMLFAWAASCYVSSISSYDAIKFKGIELQFLIGAFTYVFSLAMVAVKGLS